MMKTLLLSAAGIAAAMALAGPAQAAAKIGLYEGNDCQGGFSSCYATQSGLNVVGGLSASSVVVKFNGNERDEIADLDPYELDEISTNYGTIDGSEFDIELTGTLLEFTYTPGAGDPELHYFAIKQGPQYALFYHASPILSGSVNLSGVGFSAGRGRAFSHISFFNSTVPGVPEPGTWAMLILGFGAVGGAMRASKRRTTLAFN